MTAMSAVSGGEQRKRVVFLGTPDVAARSLELLLQASRRGRWVGACVLWVTSIAHSRRRVSSNHAHACLCKHAHVSGGGFDVVSVVTQPPAPSGRKLKLTPSPVQTLAGTYVHYVHCEQSLEWVASACSCSAASHHMPLNIEAEGLPVLTPEKAKDPAFLEALQATRPDLCITAAYGQFLPTPFLGIPRLGTLNIHPSLLPRWRGASPVQRTLQAGDAGTKEGLWTRTLHCSSLPSALVFPPCTRSPHAFLSID